MVTGAKTDGPATAADLRVELAFAPAAGWTYVRVADPQGATGSRRFRLARVLRSANIPVHVWREGALPSAAEVRTAMTHVIGPAAAGYRPTASRPMPLIPIAEMSELLADGDRAALDAAFDPSMEPVASGFYDEEVESAAASR